MKLDALRERGRRRAEQIWIRVWRHLPAGSLLRARLEALIPKPIAPSPYSQPPDEFERPPPRARVPLERADVRAIGWRAFEEGTLPAARPTLVALHHSPTPEDWLRVGRARPQFEAQVQPRLPGELAFYDPACAAVLARQVSLAQAYGLAAFAFVVHAGERQAVHTYLDTIALALPFCLVWSNEADDARFVELVRRAVVDPRYLRHLDRPLVLAWSTPTQAQASSWREACLAAGAGTLFLVTRAETGHTPPTHADALLLAALGEAASAAPPELINPAYCGEVLDFRTRSPRTLPARALALVELPRDDEPARPGRGRVDDHASPRAFVEVLARVAAASPGPLFLDAFNDWVHGAVLEPDAHLGHAYLAATRTALTRGSRALPPLPCAVVHAYYIELIDEIATALRESGLRLRLIVTTTFEQESAVRQRLAELGLDAELEAHENRGRDILPFLRVANRLVDEGVELVLKLHTKSSGHRIDGARWRAELIGRLLDRARASTIVDAFARDPRLGCVAPEGHYLPLSAYWGWNEETVRYLCRRMAVAAPDITRDYFAAGSMFWIRTAAMRPLLDAHLGEWEFTPERGYVDGTMAHGVERALGLTVQGAGFVTRTAAAICGIPFSDDAGYAYAEATGPDIR